LRSETAQAAQRRLDCIWRCGRIHLRT
jgi:hypothetical protein